MNTNDKATVTALTAAAMSHMQALRLMGVSAWRWEDLTTVEKETHVKAMAAAISEFTTRLEAGQQDGTPNRHH